MTTAAVTKNIKKYVKTKKMKILIKFRLTSHPIRRDPDLAVPRHTFPSPLPPDPGCLSTSSGSWPRSFRGWSFGRCHGPDLDFGPFCD